MPWKTAALSALTAFGTSGFATIIAAGVTATTSRGKQAQAKPNGERQRLTDEVAWLRRELEREHDKGG